MRILQLTSHLNVGGVAGHVVTLSEGLQRRGHDVVVAAESGTLLRRLWAKQIPHWAVPLKTSAEFSLPVLWAWHTLRQKLRAERCAGRPVALIHAHTRVAQVVAAALHGWTGIPYLTTWHGFFTPRLSRRWCPCMGARTIAISEPVADHLRRDFHLPAERIRVVPHGVDVEWFQSRDAEEIAELRRRLQLGPGPVIGTISRLVRDKGVEQVVVGFQQAQARVPSAQLLIVGDGPDRARLQQRIAQLGVASSVRLAGTLPDTRAALALIDVFVFAPATKEGFGLSLLEAMASARPIVAIQQGGGSSWVVEESGVGIRVGPSDPEALAEAILRLLRDGALAGQLGREAQAVAATRYPLERECEQVERVYAEVLAEGAT
ncbi:MAG: glycosyltransferase family 4 protein [Candidatus Omnitrophica bacterium]|nr:glycosyltransferase family 4 protein [Candidatus Omnitrophota bacterium]